MTAGCMMTGGNQNERLAPQVFCLASAREGRATGSAMPPAGVFGKSANAGADPCEGAE